MEISADTEGDFFFFEVGGVCYRICSALCSACCSQQRWWPFCVSAVAERGMGRVRTASFYLTSELLMKTGEVCE